MKICLAQVRSEKGDVRRNVDHHRAVLRSLEPASADLVVFPELSLSSYDPDVAGSAAIELEDRRLGAFRRFADGTGSTVAVGAPVKTSGKPLIAMLVFAPGAEPVDVGKRHLHADEVQYFSPSQGGVGMLDMSIRIGMAICYEISVVEHIEAVVAGGAALYVASVAKTPDGVAEATATLRRTAREYRVPVAMVNSVGTCEGKQAGGGSMIIDQQGHLVAQLASSTEGLLVYDTGTRSAAALSAVRGAR